LTLYVEIIRDRIANEKNSNSALVFRFVHFEAQNNSEYLYSIEAWEKLFSLAEKCARASQPIAKF